MGAGRGGALGSVCSFVGVSEGKKEGGRGGEYPVQPRKPKRRTKMTIRMKTPQPFMVVVVVEGWSCAVDESHWFLGMDEEL